MTGPDPAVQWGLIPYDLHVPTQMLAPLPRHERRNVREHSAALGRDGDAAVLNVLAWDSCRAWCKVPGGHDAGFVVTLRVPCDSLPHCNACECGSDHLIRLSAEQVAGVKAILP